MKRSDDRILTTHAGSLVRPLEIIEAMRAATLDRPYDERAFAANLQSAVADVVRRQAEIGIDVPSDGEFGKRGWIQYVLDRLGGLDHRPGGGSPNASVVFADRDRFRGFYAVYSQIEHTMWLPPGDAVPPSAAANWLCTGPITYRGRAAVERDIANFKAARAGLALEEAFMPVVAPCSVQIIQHNDFYKSDEAFVYAIADALAQEYKTIVDSGFLLQVDDAILPMHYNPGAGLDGYLKWASMQIDALNHALAGIPQDRVRYHICWGSQNVPHTWDVPLKDIVGLLLKVRAGAYSIEAANPRHEHEWQVWEETRLPDDKILIPGVVSHCTNVVEHPELVAQRIGNFARIVGRERVIAGSDCGFSQNWNLIRVHPEVQWAKLEALVAGARLASQRLWAKR